MRKQFLFLMMLIFLSVNAREFVFLQELQHGTMNYRKSFGPHFDDFNKDGNDELLLWSPASSNSPDSAYLYIYEYQSDYELSLMQTNDYYGTYWVSGTGDFDNDGFYGILGGDPDSHYLYVMEQFDSFSIPNSVTWHSDTNFHSFAYVTNSNELKPDSIDRIVGMGIPGISTTTYGLGFYYYECTGDNSYNIKTFADTLRTASSGFDVDDIDENGLVDIFIKAYGEPYIHRFETIDTTCDSFRYVNSSTSTGVHNIQVIPDTDGDTLKELLTERINYSGGGLASYGFDIYEDENGDTVLDSVWATDFVISTSNDVIFGGDIDYGDIDGDGNYEIVVCGGRHFEAWKSTANNTYTKIFEWTNPDYNTIQSHIRCHDFNKNGIDEIIYSGAGTYVGDEATFIFECRPLAKLDYTSLLDVGNLILDSIILDTAYLYAVDELPVVIDSMKLKNGYNLSIVHPSYPCSISQKDSIPVELQLFSDTNAFLSDSLIIYSNDWFGDIDYITITGSFGPSGIENSHSESNSESNISIRNNTIYYSVTSPNSSIMITDILGRVLYSDSKLNPGSYTYKADMLNNGVYFIKLQDNYTTITKKYLNIK